MFCLFFLRFYFWLRSYPLLDLPNLRRILSWSYVLHRNPNPKYPFTVEYPAYDNNPYCGHPPPFNLDYSLELDTHAKQDGAIFYVEGLHPFDTPMDDPCLPPPNPFVTISMVILPTTDIDAAINHMIQSSGQTNVRLTGRNDINGGHQGNPANPAREITYTHMHPSGQLYGMYLYVAIINNLAHVITMETEYTFKGKPDSTYFNYVLPGAMHMGRSLQYPTSTPPPECPPGQHKDVNGNCVSDPTTDWRPFGILPHLVVRDLDKNSYPITDEWINTTPTGGQSLNNVQISCSTCTGI